VSVYNFGALGNIDTGPYLKGLEPHCMMFMFLLSTFLVAVVFMNMLIAIMSNTFAEVLENAESNALSEQLALIFDNMFIVNFDRMFHN
jgi:hypothetical protein